MATHDPIPSATSLPSQPAFLIAIDTEGDNLWSLPTESATFNAAYLPRFQQLCERFQLRPSYLTNWEMVLSPQYCEFAEDVLRRDAAEIGMHLHAWNNPPLSSVEVDNPRRQACLIESPPDLMRDKVARLTDMLEDTFCTKMLSHRAGRWGMNAAYARVLVQQGYLVDCSVTPDIHWQYKYVDGTSCEIDYRGFPTDAYWCDLENFQKVGNSPLLEVPMSIFSGVQSVWARALRNLARPSRLARRIVDRLVPKHAWFRPFRRNVAQLPRLLDRVTTEGRDYIQFTIHSSELMPGGSPSFPTEAAIEQLYARLESLFSLASGRFVGLTLAEYHQRFVQQSSRCGSACELTSSLSPGN